MTKYTVRLRTKNMAPRGAVASWFAEFTAEGRMTQWLKDNRLLRMLRGQWRKGRRYEVEEAERGSGWALPPEGMRRGLYTKVTNRNRNTIDQMIGMVRGAEGKRLRYAYLIDHDHGQQAEAI